MKTVTVPIPDIASVKRGSAQVVGIFVLLYLCFAVRQIWLPLGLAFLLAMVLDPIVDRMELRKWSRMWASTFIFGSTLLIVGGLAVLAYPLAVRQIETIQKGFERYFPNQSHAGLLSSFRHMGLSQNLSNVAVSAIENGKASLQHSSTWLTDFGMSFASNAIWVVIVPIVAFYALRDFHLILAKGLLLVPARQRNLVQSAVGEITGVFGKYVRGLLFVSALNGLATAVLLTILSVPGALVIGVVAGMLYSVPYIGALLTILITAAVAFVGGGPNMLFLAVGFSFVLHQVVFDQIVSPRILGGQVGLHPILSIVALLVGNLLLGIIGMILAVPAAACIQIAVLAMIPKLSKEIEITAHEPNGDTVSSLELAIKDEHQRLDATDEMHSSVQTAVETIELQISMAGKPRRSRPSAAARKGKDI